jgi:2-keto-3-deoxy-L-rhamnonate aldolase RhmA
MQRENSFKAMLRTGRPCVGTWIKTPHPMVVEVLCRTNLEVLCLDAEHSPFDRRDLDGCIFAANASGMPVLVRVPSPDAHQILNALDLGATGIVVPHVRNAREAEAAVRHSHFEQNGRGYAGSTRAARYTGRTMTDHIKASQAATVVVAQIEDVEGVDAITEIVSVDRLDCVFVGRADLAVSYGAASPADAVVVEAATRVAKAARAANLPVGMFVSDFGEIPGWVKLGVTLFLLESDHVFLLRGANQLIERCRTASGTPST